MSAAEGASKRTSERCERTSEWPSTYVRILGCSAPFWKGEKSGSEKEKNGINAERQIGSNKKREPVQVSATKNAESPCHQLGQQRRQRSVKREMRRRRKEKVGVKERRRSRRNDGRNFELTWIQEDDPKITTAEATHCGKKISCLETSHH